VGDWELILAPVDHKCDDENNINSSGMFVGWTGGWSVFTF
jgi:hypothetical protein